MQTDRDVLERGARVVRSLGEVMPEGASPEVARLYEDIRDTLRVPIVNFLFRVLANRPEYLEHTWSALRPGLRTELFEGAADTLRQAALAGEPASLPERGSWSEWPDGTRLRRFTETIHYVLPKLLLIATAMRQGRLRPSAEALASAAIEPGPHETSESIEMLDPARATGKVECLFARIRERHGHPGVASYFRALGHWPDFLAAAWQRLEPRVQTQDWRADREDLVRRAEDEVRRLFDEAPEIDRADEDIRAAVTLFQEHLVPDLLLDVGLVRAWLSGPETARVSRLSALSP